MGRQELLLTTSVYVWARWLIGLCHFNWIQPRAHLLLLVMLPFLWLAKIIDVIWIVAAGKTQIRRLLKQAPSVAVYLQQNTQHMFVVFLLLQWLQHTFLFDSISTWIGMHAHFKDIEVIFCKLKLWWLRTITSQLVFFYSFEIFMRNVAITWYWGAIHENTGQFLFALLGNKAQYINYITVVY